MYKISTCPTLNLFESASVKFSSLKTLGFFEFEYYKLIPLVMPLI